MLLKYYEEDKVEVGCDEVGRGSLAGPVVAASVIWNPKFEDGSGMLEKIRDSKKLSSKAREEVAGFIKNNAVDWSISFVDVVRIDEINILNATYEAIHKSLDQLLSPYDSIIVDGNRFKTYNDIPHTCIVKADDKYLSVAAASIIAKVERDKYMKELAIDDKYKLYEWSKNMGYGTKHHIDAIKKYGLSDQHRKSFRIKNID